MRRARILVPLALGLGLVVLAPGRAGADCAGPTISYQTGPVARGGTLTVDGETWGDSCYDTGEPPPGEGVLGRPVRDIEVLIVQGSRRVVVAEGDAGEDFTFTVEVVVPVELEPGPATITARAGDVDVAVFDATAMPVTITDDPPIGTPGPGPASFGPSDTTTTAPPSSSSAPSSTAPSSTAPSSAGEAGSDGSDDGSSVGWLRVAGGVLAVGVLAGVLWVSRRGGGR